MALQTIVARKIGPKFAPVISIPTMTTGPNESHNVIPDEVKLLGTVRSQDKNVRAQVPVLIEQIVKGLTAAHGAEYRFDYQLGYAAVMNDPAVADVARAMARRVMADEKAVAELPHARFGGEDFSAYLEEAPGCFLRIGCTDPNAGSRKVHGLHTCRLLLHEEMLPIGARMHTAFVYHELMEGGK
ncbi:amidohydrolase [Novymonas esmeraldas]|uniref:Amidohydrolase n=1 Tax=Novymonas esmeraldas TaxID=1808958 RepID=A0AAW0F0J9_9TRYP